MKTIQIKLSDNALFNNSVLRSEIVDFLNKMEIYSEYELDNDNTIIEYCLVLNIILFLDVINVKKNEAGTYDIILDYLI